MKSLFTKILLWFVATVAVTFVGFFVITAMTIQRAEPGRSPRNQFAELQLQRARFAYESGGTEGLARLLERTRRRGGRFRGDRPPGPRPHADPPPGVRPPRDAPPIRRPPGASVPRGSRPGDFPRTEIHLTDAQGRDLLTGEDLSAVKNSDPSMWWFLFGSRRPSFTRVVSDGEYRYIVRSAEPDEPFWFFNAQHLWVLAVSILFCSALAYYLTAPLRNLRRTVERFGQGDFSARTHAKRRDELGELGRTFDRMAERIQVLLSAERRLLQDVSHELRSPLARLGVAAALAESDADRPAALKQIGRESERLNTLIGELLQVTRAEGDKESLRLEIVRLDELVGEVADDCGVEAQARNCKLAFRSASTPTVKGDPELLRRAVENLVRNAIRHTADGTIVDVKLDSDGDRALVSVRDHGSGVPEENLSRIFDPFYRVESDRNRGSGGTGLGLSIARRAVDLHKGSIRARNAHPGLVVEVEIPLSGEAKGDGASVEISEAKTAPKAMV